MWYNEKNGNSVCLPVSLILTGCCCVLARRWPFVAQPQWGVSALYGEQRVMIIVLRQGVGVEWSGGLGNRSAREGSLAHIAYTHCSVLASGASSLSTLLLKTHWSRLVRLRPEIWHTLSEKDIQTQTHQGETNQLRFVFELSPDGCVTGPRNAQEDAHGSRIWTASRISFPDLSRFLLSCVGNSVQSWIPTAPSPLYFYFWLR